MDTAYTETGTTTPVGTGWSCPSCKRRAHRAHEVDTHDLAGQYLGTLWLCQLCAVRKRGETVRQVLNARADTGDRGPCATCHGEGMVEIEHDHPDGSFSYVYTTCPRNCNN